jgi:hypothetical protein
LLALVGAATRGAAIATAQSGTFVRKVLAPELPESPFELRFFSGAVKTNSGGLRTCRTRVAVTRFTSNLSTATVRACRSRSTVVTARDGHRTAKELFYVDKTALMTVTADFSQQRPDIARPRKALEGHYVWDRISNVDITPDGQRFVFIRRTDGSDPSATLRLLLNWVPQP